MRTRRRVSLGRSRGLAAGHPATRELAATAAGAGKPIDGCPANPAVVADPGFAIGRDASEERQLPIAAIGLRPIAFAGHFEAAQIDCATDGVNAVGIAVGIYAGQQIGAAGAVGQARDLSPGIDRDQQRKAQ